MRGRLTPPVVCDAYPQMLSKVIITMMCLWYSERHGDREGKRAVSQEAGVYEGNTLK